MGGNVERILEKETVKWLERIEKEIPRAEIKEITDKDRIREVVENINAYIRDCRHFLEKRDFVNAFEAVVYAWGILETCEHLGAIERH